MKILHLIDSLHYGGSARQLQLLGPALANQSADVEICCLGPDTPSAESLRQAGVSVHTLGWTRWFDFCAVRDLRVILRQTPFELIHVWHLPTLRILAVVANDLLPRVVMSAPLSATGKLAWWDRQLLQRVRCVALADVSDQERCLRHGIVQPILRVMPSAVEKKSQDPFSKKGSDTFFRVACIGKLERDAGFRQAIWAFDFVRFLFPTACLQIVGAGSQLAALQTLADGLECGDHVQFLGTPAHIGDVLETAEIVWIPSQANTGRQVALEAMAHGRPVIASDVPCLRELLRDGDTGYLVPVGDAVQFARRTRMLFEDARLRAQIGANARRFVDQQFPLEEVAERWRDLYRNLVACGASTASRAV